MATEVVVHTRRKMKLGETVHYVLPKECMRGGECRPAIVIEGGTDVVRLQVLVEPTAGPRNLGFDVYPVANENNYGRHGTWHRADVCPNGN